MALTPREAVLEKLAQRRNDAMYRLADAVIGFSAGALALTISLRGSIASARPVGLWTLKGAWCAFALAAALGLLARKAEIVVFQKLIERLRQNDDMPAAAPHAIYGLSFNLCLLSFAVAVALLTAFGLLNL